ncbi:MAG TPA: conjugal transfer protein TrbH [Devosia sp.]|nr:conjugal transfer protein TrbH [Devosia sp.]
MPGISPVGRVGALLLIITLAACQTLGGAGLVTSTVTTALAQEAAGAIADDMVGQLADQVGPGNTTIALALDGSVFGQALEASLKGRGYAIVTDQKAGNTATVPLAYVVDDFEGNVLVRMSTAAIDLTQIYKVSETGAEPISPLSVMARSGDETP